MNAERRSPASPDANPPAPATGEPPEATAGETRPEGYEEGHADGYQAVLLQSFASAYRNQQDGWTREDAMAKAIDRLLASLADRENLAVLDIGTGRGHHAAAMLARGWQVTGLDLVAVEDWQHIATRHGERARFEVAIFPQWSCTRRFDLIVDHGCFHHQDPSVYDAYLDRIRELLVPGGFLFMSVFAALGHDADKRVFDRNERFSQVFAREEMAELLRQHGLILRSSEILPRVFQSKHYLLLWAQAGEAGEP